MKFWTVQKDDVLKVILDRGIFIPDFNYRSNNRDMRTVYPYLLDEYNRRNSTSCKGLIFGFGLLENEVIDQIEQFYRYFIENPLVAAAFDFWNEKYSILKLNISDGIDVTPIEFNDFIKLCIDKTNDIARMQMLQLLNPGYSFKEDIKNIQYQFKEGIATVNDCVQIHYSCISSKDIIDIYPNFNYKTGTHFELSDIAKKLKIKI